MYMQVEPPPLTVTTYHLFESKYSGLANRDAGDFKGDAGFIFNTFSNWSKGNPEASMEHNIIEMSEVNVTGWGHYEECNAPGANQGFSVHRWEHRAPPDDVGPCLRRSERVPEFGTAPRYDDGDGNHDDDNDDCDDFDDAAYTNAYATTAC